MLCKLAIVILMLRGVEIAPRKELPPLPALVYSDYCMDGTQYSDKTTFRFLKDGKTVLTITYANGVYHADREASK